MNEKVIRAIKLNYMNKLSALTENNFDYCYSMYEVALIKNNYKALKILCEKDNRKSKDILNDLFHLLNINNCNTVPIENKKAIIKKIKSNEIVIPRINKNFINNLENVEKFKRDIIEKIKKNKIADLKLFLLRKDFSIEYINNENFDLLIYAINNYSDEIVNNIIPFYQTLNYSFYYNTKPKKNRSKINHCSGQYVSPLYMAIIKNKFELVKLLLKHGADINYEINGENIITKLYNNHSYIKPKALKLILWNKKFRKTAKLNDWVISKIKEKECNKFLELFMEFYPYDNSLSTILQLLSIYQYQRAYTDAQVKNIYDEKWNIPVDWINCAIEYDNTNLIYFFMRLKIDANRKAAYGDTPLYMAFQKRKSVNHQHQHIIKYLIHSANINKKFKNGDTPLNYSIKYCYQTVFQELLDYGADPNKKSKDGNTPLITAILMNNIKIVKRLLIHGARINLRNSECDTPLVVAIKKGNREIMNFLINRGASLKKTDKNNRTLLDIAIDFGNHQKEGIIEDLMDYDVHINDTTCLIKVINKNFNCSIITYLIDKGAKINIIDEELFKTPLDLAIIRCNEKTIQCLMEYDANLNDQNCLIYALERNFSEKTIKYLIDHGANVNECTLDGITPLYIAIDDKREDIIIYLLEHGAKFSDTSKNIEKSPLLHAIENSISFQTMNKLITCGLEKRTRKKILKSIYLHMAITMNNEEVIKTLVYYGIEINKCDEIYGTPLMHAIENKNENIIKFLIINGATHINRKKYEDSLVIHLISDLNEPLIKFIIDHKAFNLNTTSENGDSLLYYAISNGSESMVQYLIENGAIVDSNIDISVALNRGMGDEIILCLLDHGASLNNNTPLIDAIENNYSEEIVKYIIDHGVDINKVDKNGKTALQYAIKKRKEILIRYLVENGAMLDILDKEKELPIVLELEKDNGKLIQYLKDQSSTLENESDVIIVYEKNFKESIMEYLIDHDRKHSYTSFIDKTQYLYEAIDNYYSEALIMTLIEYGADVNDRRNGSKSILLRAIEKHYSEALINLIIQYSSDINQKDEDGNTALMIALEHSSEAIIKTLIKNGAEINIRNNKGKSPIAIAIENCSESIITSLLDYGAIIETEIFINVAINKNFSETLIVKLVNLGADCHEGSPLIQSIEKGYSDNILKLLVDHGVNLHLKNERNKTALILLIEKKNENMVKYLLEHGAKVNCIEDEDEDEDEDNEDDDQDEDEEEEDDIIPLNVAIKRNSETIVKYLVEYGAEISISDMSMRKPLVLAVYNSNFSITKYLIDHINHPINKMNINLYKVIIMAMKNNDSNIVKYFVSHGALKDMWYSDIILYPIKMQNSAMVKFLIDHGTKMDGEDYQTSKSFLTTAISTNNMDIVKYMIEHEQEPLNTHELDFDHEDEFEDNSRDPCYKYEALLWSIRNHKPQFAKYLIDHGANWNENEYNLNDEETPIHTAILYREFEIIKYFIENGINPETISNDRSTLIKKSVLIEAYEHKNYEAIQFIIENALEYLGSEDQFYHYINLALECRSLSLLTYYVEKVLKTIDDVNEDGETLFIVLLKNTKKRVLNIKYDMIKYLVEKGANVNRKDKYNESIISIAKKTCNRSTIDFLINHGAKE